MTRFKQTLVLVRDHVARRKEARNARRASFYQQAPRSIRSVHSSLSSAPARPSRTPYTGDRTTYIPLHALRKVPATVTVEPHAAHVCKFSRGPGLIVYIIGALISAARVALKVNIATLELVRRLPLDELSAVGACLAAAFADDGRRVDVAWAEVGSETERDWRKAECSWTRYPGGPYEAFEIEEHSDNSLLQQSLRPFEERELDRLGQQGPVDAAKFAAFRERHLPLSSEGSYSLRSGGEDSLLSLPRAGSQVRPVMTAAEFNALLEYSDSSNSPSA